jgi:coproporphyrinogen III oxidase-like Fe-S oxidoreductase
MLEKIIRIFSKIYRKIFLNFEAVSRSEEIYAIAESVPQKVALYVHVPFCRSQCQYCTFLKFRFDEATVRKYFVFLKKELERYLALGVCFSEVYIGGGTPTIDSGELASFVKFVKDKTGVEMVSVETILSDVDEANSKMLKQAGVTRISIGLQSVHQPHRDLMRRSNLDIQEAQDKINQAAKVFDIVSVDFIFNLPNQTKDEIKKDLDFFLELENVDGSFYPLLSAGNEKENAFSRVDLKKQKEYYYFIVDTLRDHGLRALTTWSFSKSRSVSSEYIAHCENYVGIGCGAISKMGRVIYVNTFSLEKYFGMIEKGLAVVERKIISARDVARYRMLMELFGMKAKSKDTTGEKLFFEIFLAKILGIVTEKRGVIEVTKRGMYYVGFAMREFFDLVSDLRAKSVKEKL